MQDATDTPGAATSDIDHACDLSSEIVITDAQNTPYAFQSPQRMTAASEEQNATSSVEHESNMSNHQHNQQGQKQGMHNVILKRRSEFRDDDTDQTEEGRHALSSSEEDDDEVDEESGSSMAFLDGNGHGAGLATNLVSGKQWRCMQGTPIIDDIDDNTGPYVDDISEDELYCNPLLLFAVCWIFMLMTTAQTFFSRSLAAGGVTMNIQIQQALGIGVGGHTKATADALVQSFEWVGPDGGPWVLYIGAALLWWKRMTPRDIYTSTSTSSSSPPLKRRVRWIGRELPVRILLLAAVGRVVKWFLNVCFRQGRPFWISSDVAMLHCPKVYGSPSGHTVLWLLFVWPLGEHLVNAIISSRREATADHNQISQSLSYQAAAQTQTHTKSRWGARWCTELDCINLARIMLIVFLIVIYSAMLFSRLALGTHLPYDLVYGIGTGALLLVLFSAHNVRVLTRWLDQAPRGTFCVTWTAMMRLIMLTLGLVAIVEVTVWSFHDGPHVVPDPKEWQIRVDKGGCSTILDTRNLKYAYKSIGLLIGWAMGMMLVAPDVWCGRVLEQIYTTCMRELCPSPQGSLQDTPQAQWLFTIFRALASAATGFAIMAFLAEQVPAYLEAKRASRVAELDKRAKVEMVADRSVEVWSCICCMIAMCIVIAVRGRRAGERGEGEVCVVALEDDEDGVVVDESRWLLADVVPHAGRNAKSRIASPVVNDFDDVDSYLV